MRLERISGVAAIALLATMGSALAVPCTGGFAAPPGGVGCSFVIDSTSFTPLNFGTTGAGTTNARVGAIPLPTPNPTGITTIVTVPGMATGDLTQTSGLYVGTQANIATSPFGSGSNRNYLAAQPGGSVTINYGTPQTAFDLLWGTVDRGTTYNLVTNAANAFSINGSEILDAAGGGSGTQNLGVEISFTTAFSSIRLEDQSGNPSAFEFVPGARVPEPASLALLGSALIGFGLIRRRRKSA